MFLWLVYLLEYLCNLRLELLSKEKRVELVGNAEVYPASSVSFEERQRAYAIRRQWLRLTPQEIEQRFL
jgi:hypothetical protein